MSIGVRVGRLDLVRLVEEAQHLEDFEEAIAAAARALPADAGSIIDFLEIPSGDAFDVAPEQAIGYFKAKGLTPTFSYAEMLDYQHDQAFTIAKMMNVDMLGQVRASLDSALAGGQTFKDWADTVTPILQSGGWWGRKQVVDPLTGREVVAQLGSPWRLETIFRTNMQQAYAAGAWQEIDAQKEIAPFLMYDAVDDFRTRPLHASWDRKVLPVTNAWWNSHYPPNGYNCRCGVIQLSQEEVDALGLKVSRDPPDDGTDTWTNPRTGEKAEIPRGIDPGFEHNAGKSWKWKLQELEQQKLQALQADMKVAAERAAARQAKQAAQQAAATTEAAKEAQKALAAAQAQAALARAKALAEEKAKQWVAQQQLDLIAKGKEAAGAGAAYKVKALAELKKSPAWLELRPAEQLQQVLDTAADLKKKADLSKALSLYKTQILAGKTPSPAAVKAFKSLPQADADAFIAKIDAEKKAAEAKAAAAAAKAAEEAAQQAAAAAQPVKAATFIDPPAPNPDSMVVIGRKSKGGTPGALYQDTATGQKWLVKFNGSEDAVQNEVLASKLYNLAGVEAPELHAIRIDGKPALASKIIDGIAEVPAKTLASTPSVTDGFAVDAWLANWDVAGLNFDNVVLVNGRALRIDVGGSLRYRAVGGLKGAAFGRTVGEIDSLRDGTNAQARQVFGGMSAADVERSAEKVLAVSDDDIRAVIMRYGPADMDERRALAELMIARKADLARRFPAAAERVRQRQGRAEQAPSQAAARVTAAEQEAVEASRVNGYGFPTDSDQIEDNMVVVHAFRRADGSDATRGFFKLMPDASRELANRIAATAAAPNAVPLATARDAILSAVKSINFRAENGKALDATVVAKVKTALDAIDVTLPRLRNALGQAKDIAALQARIDDLQDWRKTLESVGLEAKTGSKAVKLPRSFDDKSFPDELAFTLKAQRQVEAAGLKWKRVSGGYQFDAAKFDRSFATEGGSGAGLISGARVRYEAELPDGTRVTYFPHQPEVVYSLQGVVKIDLPGKGADTTGKVFDVIGQMGLKSTRATEIDRQHLYLNAFSRIRLLRGAPAKFKSAFDAITDRTEAGVKAKLALLKQATGVDIEASEGWRQIDGVRQAFGHGRAYQIRPDLSGPEFDKFDAEHILYHNPIDYRIASNRGVFEKLKMIFDGGGMMASLADRMRRGVPLNGSSVSSDLDTGGGDFVFTRIRKKVSAGETGIYWKASNVRRMDAIVYTGDPFGKTRDGYLEANRLGQDVASLREVGSQYNETNFKGGLSLFDGIDRIVLWDKAEVKAAIEWLNGKGYKTWPDGRSLDEVIVAKGAK